MLNNCVLMGRMKELEIKENNGEKMGIMHLSIPKDEERIIVVEML